MRNTSPQQGKERSVIRSVLLLVLLSALPLLLPPVCAAEAPKKVLIFSSEDQFIPAITLVNQAIRTTMKNGSASQVQFFYEAQDSFRIATEKYEGELVGLLRRKYDGENIDLIYVFGPPALRFLLKHQGELFSGTPMVFVVTDQRRVMDLSLGKNVTGVSGKIELKPTLDVALTLQPQTQRVVVVAGKASLDSAMVEQAHEEFRAYEGKVEFIYLTGLPIGELRNKLAQLPEKSIIFYLSISSDDAGKFYTNPEVLALLAPSANAPIYGASQTFMGTGMIGGMLIDYEAIGTRAAEMGLRILAGESPQNIPLEVVPNTTMFDWRKLRRWGIDESRLPAGSEVRFKEPTFWEQYKWRIVGVVSLCILEALLIVWLLISRARRREAERESERLARVAEAERRRLDEVVSNVPGIVWETRFEADHTTRKAYFVSDHVEQMLGYSVDEWLSTPNFALTILVDEDRERITRATEAMLESGKEGFLEFRWMAKDGRVLWVEAQIAAIRDETGQSVGLRGVTMDITDRKKAEAALTESEERYRNVVETQTELICRYQPDSTLTFVNDAYCRYFGRTRDQLIGTKFIQLVPEHARDAALSHVASLIENPSAETYEHEVVLPNGNRGWQQWIDHVVVTNGHGVELQGIGRDITARRRAEEALHVSETRFRTMADSAPLLIWMAGPDRLCSYLNQGWLEFTGRTLAQELGTGWTDGIFKEDYVRCMDIFQAAFDRREPFKMEYRLRRADGVFCWVYSSGAPRFSSEGEFLGYIGSCVDIADRKEAEQALQTAHEEVSQLKNQLQAENIYLQEEIKLAHNVDEIIGGSNAIKYVLFKIERVSQTDTSVLILGETGTGKELVARAIHNQSLRKDRPLVKVNCAALAPSLIESELFGHEKGAFTGASARKIGRFELANGATMFLDEIGELPLDLQSKLLRVVQEGEFERLGGTKTLKVDVRILAATNRNLKMEVERGAFREDLWYRLNVFPITVPPLRQRKEDIPSMVEHFANGFSKKIGKEITSISPSTLQKLHDYGWPGNVRELANVIERAVINTHGAVLQIADQFEQQESDELSSSAKTLHEMEKEYILSILDQTSWRIEGSNGAAKILGLNPSTLRTRMVKLGIQKSLRALAGSAGFQK
jgi:PAS domain S-box-containing protein